jgi:hypothetical protein
MFEESFLKARGISKRQVIDRGGALVFGLTAVTLWVLEQAYLFHTPRYARLPLSFIVLDIFTLSWIFVAPILWKWSQRNQLAEK